jgi:shikimate dehydrogenase
MEVYGLVGSPVEHSLSPPMHEAAYAELGLDARYVTLEPDADRLGEAVAGADALGVAGLNVTVPFKQDVLEHVDPSPTAQAVGAVNTVDFSGEAAVGYNTDVAGVRRALEHNGVGIDGQSAVVVGAGGAGRAAAYALADAGAQVHVANRTVERAEGLAAEFADHDVSGGGLGTLDATVPGADLLVNATSVGMEGDDSPVSAELLHEDLSVLDVVYAPLRTRLLRDADAAGATTVDGAWMLLYQGVEAFERWIGRPAPVEAMNDALRSRL